MKNIFKILAFVSVVAFVPACESNLEVEPYNSLDAAGGFKTKQDVDAALLGAYSAILSSNYYGLQMQVLPDLYADILSHTGTFPTYAQVFNRQILADNTSLTSLWNTVYVAVDRSNNVIASAPAVTDPSFNVNSAVAEARALRAFHYFNLLRLYGGSSQGFNTAAGLGLPIYTTPTLSAEDAAPKARSSEADTWKLIMEDLEFAVANLGAAKSRGRITRFVAQSLKARAHLYRGEWAAAETAATDVIANGGYTLLPGATFSNIWLGQNTGEGIWELQYDINNTNSIAFWYYPTAQGGRNEFTSTASLNAGHEDGDVRKTVNVSVNPANKTQKYTRISGTDNVMLVRLSEMYLIRAEARAQQNKIAEGVADLNVIRNRAGLPAVNPATTADLVSAVLKERRFEFAHEGHRWFDLRRTGNWNALGLTEPFRALWPIPLREIQTSGNIIAQNPGY
jgi:starch-binding outer membrane protein, SusD/RagB family